MFKLRKIIANFIYPRYLCTDSFGNKLYEGDEYLTLYGDKSPLGNSQGERRVDRAKAIMPIDRVGRDFKIVRVDKYTPIP